MPAYKFQAPDGRKFTLSGDSPPNEQELEEAFASLPAVQPSSRVPRGGASAPLPPEVAKFIAGQRVLERELESRGSAPGLTIGPGGEILETSAFASIPRAIAEGLGAGASLDLSDAIGKLATNADFTSENQPRVQNPKAFEFSKFVGGLAPTAAVGQYIVKPGARLAQKVIGGGLAAAGAGAVSGGAQTVVESGRETQLNDLITNVLIGGAGAGLVGAAIPLGSTVAAKTVGGIGNLAKGIISPVKSLQDMGILKSAESVAVKILNPKGTDIREVAESVTSGRLLKPFQNIKSEGSFNDASSFFSNGRKALITKSNAVEGLITKNPDFRFNGTDAAEAMVNEVASDPLISSRNPELIELIRNNSEILRKDISLREGFDLLKSINKRHENYFTASVKGQNTKELDAEFATDEIMRKFLSRKLNDASEGLSGVAENPFREYGAISDVLQKTQKEFQGALINRLNQVGGGGTEDFVKNFDFSKPATWVSTVKFLKGGELGAFNKRFDSLNKILPKKEAARVITPEERLSKVGRIPTAEEQRNIEMVQSVADPVPATLSPQTLQNLIQQNLSTVQAATANAPLRAPISLPSGAPPSSNQIIQDLIQQEAIRKAKEAAGSNIGYF